MLVKLILGVLMVLAGSAYFIDFRLKKPQIEALRRRIEEWLNQAQEADFKELLARSHRYYIKFFDAFYGDRHFTWR